MIVILMEYFSKGLNNVFWDMFDFASKYYISVFLM